jgi:hypothetical protein
MATLAEIAEWVEGIYQLETTDPALGGAPNEATGAGIINVPAQQLAKRTLFLRTVLEEAGIGAETGTIVTNMDTVDASGFYAAAPAAIGSPDSASSIAFLHVPGSASTEAYQFAFRLGTINRVWLRRKNASAWGSWVQLLTNDGIGTMAAQNAAAVTITGGSITGITDLAIADGGTGASTAAQARINLGLGSGATVVMQTSADDATAGRGLLVGAFGLGGNAISVSDLDALSVSGLYEFAAAATGSPDATAAFDGTVIHIEGALQRTQIASLVTTDNQVLFVRIDDRLGAGWQSWFKLLTGADTIPLNRGGTGATSASAARTALGAAASSTDIIAGNGLTGGGDLSANRTITMGTPSAITATSSNTVTATSHTHALTSATVRTLLSEASLGAVGTYAFLRRNAKHTPILKGEIIAGSALRYAGVIDSDGDYLSQLELSDNTAPSGSWMAMGSVGSITTQYSATVFLRVA